MAEHSEWTDSNEAIHQVIEEIPSSSPIVSGKEAEATEGTSTSDDPVAAEITPKSPAAVAVNSTPAIQKRVRGSQLKKVTTPAVTAPSPPTTRSAVGKKRQEQRRAEGNDLPLGSLPEAEAHAESNEGQTEPRRSLWPREMACSVHPENNEESLVSTGALHDSHSASHRLQVNRGGDAQLERVLSTPLGEYKEMIGSDVYEEFERARQKSPAKTAWYHENMTSSAAAYILSFGEVSSAKDAQLVTEEEAKKQGKPLSSKQKKDMWDARVKEVCASWSSQVFNLKIELLKVHYSDEKTREKYHHPTKFDVDNDLRPWLAQWALWSSLELLSCDIVRKIGIVRGPKEEDDDERTARLDGEVDRFRQYFEDTRDTYWTSIWYPVEDRQEVLINIKRAKRLVFRYYVWHLQTEKAHACFLLWRNVSHKFSMYNNQDTLCRGLLTLSEWEIENCPWWVEQPCEEEHVKYVGDAEQVCWDKILKEEDPFNVSHDRFESGEEDEVLTRAEFVEPSKNIDGLVLDTSRTKKQKEARQSSKAEEEEETGGSTPTGKAKEQPKPESGKFCLNPRLSSGVRRKFDWLIAETISYLNSIREGRTRSAKKQTKDKAPKKLKKKRDELAEAEPVLETPALEIEPNVTEAGTSTPVVEEQAPGNDKSSQKEEARQRKRTKKQANTVLYEGVFREDIYYPMKNICVIVKSSLKETHELLHGNKTKAIKDPVPIVEELKKMCAALESKRAGGYLMNKKPVQTAADCL
ncbi:hypothetical protein R1sor_015292 [Riccia sorocarpa]|uniref:Uncharacterized protein n=1 Tax=Riccia sorocarpa TaxID=122646 RepID=A0ABD3HBU1_9MARC